MMTDAMTVKVVAAATVASHPPPGGIVGTATQSWAIYTLPVLTLSNQWVSHQAPIFLCPDQSSL